MESLEETGKLLEKYNLQKLNNEDIENKNRIITSNESETVINNIPTSKSPAPDGFKGKFHQTFREELTPILPKSCRGRNTPKLTLCGHHHPDTKTRQRNHT